jgi:hypothetical protein
LRSVRVQWGDAAALVFAREPSRHTAPQAPVGDVAIDIEVAANLVESPVLIDRVVDLKNQQVELPGVFQFRNRHTQRPD